MSSHAGRSTGMARRSLASIVTLAASLLLTSLLILTGCGSDGAAENGSAADWTEGAEPTDLSTQPADDSIQGTVTVLAAASLTEAFTELATQLEQQHPSLTVELSFGSSTTLAQQITEGAEADVYASAGKGALEQLPADFASASDTVDIASNVLAIAVPTGNPGGITTLEDFARSDIDTVLCADTVPCGKAADEAFARASITPAPASREIDVKATLSKVTLGEADGAIVYQSDVATAGDGIEGIEIPADLNVSVTYPLLWSNTDPATLALVDLVRSEQGLEALEAAGFGAP